MSHVFLMVTGKRVNWKGVEVSWCARARSFGGVWSAEQSKGQHQPEQEIFE